MRARTWFLGHTAGFQSQGACWLCVTIAQPTELLSYHVADYVANAWPTPSTGGDLPRGTEAAEWADPCYQKSYLGLLLISGPLSGLHFLKSQVAQNHRPLRLKLAHKRAKVARSYRPLPFQVHLRNIWGVALEAQLFGRASASRSAIGRLFRDGPGLIQMR